MRVAAQMNIMLRYGRVLQSRAEEWGRWSCGSKSKPFAEINFVVVGSGRVVRGGISMVLCS